jgi:NiFe hydrogenase small subunit HydA
MNVSRRDFLKAVSLSAAALGLTQADVLRLHRALADPNAPSVVWLQGAGCTGCSVSFLNRMSGQAPQTAADVLINSINLVYHPNVMALAGDSAVAQAEAAYSRGGYVLVVEGGVPQAFGGAPCWAWTYNGQDVTFAEAVRDLAARAAKVVCVGNCASFGGVAAAPPNPTKVVGVNALTGSQTINIAGCPAHPDWLTWAIVQILLGKSIALDTYGRPKALYGPKTVHDQCPRREKEEAERYGLDGRCLEELGCRGPGTLANCPIHQWNNGVSWCVDANSPCIGCTDPAFPFVGAILGGEGDD